MDAEYTRQEQRLLLSLAALQRAISALDIAIDYDHAEELHADVLDAIADLDVSVAWLRQFAQVDG